MRIGIDVMGGDNAPGEILKGSVEALSLLSDEDRLCLIGDEAAIRDYLKEAGVENDPKIEIEATTQTIGMDESPVNAVREKQDSSIVRMCRLGSGREEGKECDIVISAGNTGACVAAASMMMRRLPGVQRPGIVVTIPTFSGPVVLCDVGANPEPKPSHLHQYAIMGALYSKEIIGNENPRVALMSIGAEEGKGNSLVKETAVLLKEDPKVNYTGYIEGRGMFQGEAEVIVTEGFTGNVVLKLAEGLSSGIFKTIARELMEEAPELAPQFQKVVKKIYSKHDYHEHGGAPLMGAKGIFIICHGSSEARTITNTIAHTLAYAKKGINESLVEALKS